MGKSVTMRRWLVILVFALAPLVYAQKSYVPPAGKWERKPPADLFALRVALPSDLYDQMTRPPAIREIKFSESCLRFGPFDVPQTSAEHDAVRPLCRRCVQLVVQLEGACKDAGR